jgi:hypothetical protein
MEEEFEDGSFILIIAMLAALTMLIIYAGRI